MGIELSGLALRGSFKGRSKVPLKGLQVPVGSIEGRFRVDVMIQTTRVHEGFMRGLRWTTWANEAL